MSTQVSYVLGKKCGSEEEILVTDGEQIEKKSTQAAGVRFPSHQAAELRNGTPDSSIYNAVVWREAIWCPSLRNSEAPRGSGMEKQIYLDVALFPPPPQLVTTFY